MELARRGFYVATNYSEKSYEKEDNGDWIAATLNIAGSVGLGLLGVFLGAAVVRLVF